MDMKFGFYPRLAASGMRKMRQLFLPYGLTCAGMVMMFYIILFLAVDDSVGMAKGGYALQQIFALGSWVIAIFSCIFLFYTNSFLMKRRKSEFGLYHVLGMGKAQIGRILFWETLFTALLSVGGGLFFGIALSKFAQLGLINLMQGEVTYDFDVSWLAVKRSLQVFGAIFCLLLLNSVRQIRFSSAISLMRSQQTGEKPPKGNYLYGILGLLLLSGAYYIAVTVQDPLTALGNFFVAVVMVIVGTYLVMIAGSVCFLRLLQKNRRFYYRPSHFVSVSSMVYRMKRGGAGLASICVLATMVLVMMASVSCLYFGEERLIESRYPGDYNLTFHFSGMDGLSAEKIQTLQDTFTSRLADRGIAPQNSFSYRNVLFYASLEGEEAVPFQTGSVDMDYRLFVMVPLADYNAITGAQETLEEGEALLYAHRSAYRGDTISFRQGNSFRIKKQIQRFVENPSMGMDILPGVFLVVPSLEEGMAGLEALESQPQESLLSQSASFNWFWYFDTGLEVDEQITDYYELSGVIRDPAAKESLGYESCLFESQAINRQDFYSLYGSLFYLGLLLSIVFVLATVLIIYYKQLSEGYEDQGRFAIMQKVGMTRREIRRTVNSQLLTVFFLPLALAALHLAFAFPIIRRMLLMFNMDNVPLFAATTIISLLVFSLFYTAVYRMTSNAYYRIVSGGADKS